MRRRRHRLRHRRHLAPSKPETIAATWPEIFHDFDERKTNCCREWPLKEDYFFAPGAVPFPASRPGTLTCTSCPSRMASEAAETADSKAASLVA